MSRHSVLEPPIQESTAAAPKEATAFTKSANAAILKNFPFADAQDFEDVRRGLIATLPNMEIKNAEGQVVWTLKGYEFLAKEQAPDTVNPSLWRQSRLNMANGLFKVVDRVYQIRGFDLSNMAIIEGDTGIMLIDPLVSPESAKAGLDLYYANRPKKPVVAVMYTHSHVDHYGGVKGVVSEADVAAGKVKIIAPEGFLEEAISENVYAGTAMGRRAIYHAGLILHRGEKGQVDDGLGKTGSSGASTLIPPTVTITRTGETLTVDGIQMEFQMAPSTEAPAEMLIYFPQFKVLDAAEDVTHNLHNLYTLRGAQVRDAKTWWKVIHYAIHHFGHRTEAIIAHHHWPTWGTDRILALMANQRDMYKYIHDQSLNLANKGFTPIEIAEQLQLPPGLASKWYNRDYYGSVNHNAKAVYQRYLGWYDGNPAHLYPHIPVDAAKKYVEYMGGSSHVIQMAREDFARGDYRWVAEVMDRVVFADPSNKEARELEADALEQLGYQTENAVWRNNFLQGASELRSGIPKTQFGGVATPDVVAAMSSDMLLDYMGIRLNTSKAAGKSIRINWKQPRSHEVCAITVESSVLIYTEGKSLPDPGATITIERTNLANVLMGGSSLDAEVQAGRAKIEGDRAQVTSLFGMLDSFELMFPIVEP